MNLFVIDDKLKHDERFRERGGMAYQYTTDVAFTEWAQEMEERGDVMA